jgi:hypothetical protein
MKFGLSLISGATTVDRARIVNQSLTSLSKTNVKDLEKPIIWITHSDGVVDYTDMFKELSSPFELVAMTDNPKIAGPMALAVNNATVLLDVNPSVTHVIFLWDDFIYNPEWLQELNKLVARHPDGKAWSIYRSAYTRHHRIIGGDGVDVLMTMHDGIGCVTREEWFGYSKTHNGHDFSVPPDFPGGGCTPDIHHAYARPGDRWATSKDYAQNIGRHPGIENVDCAIEFVGE